MKYLIKTTETYRVDTEEEAIAIEDAARNSNMYEMVDARKTRKVIKHKDEDDEEIWVVTITKSINDIKLPDTHLKVTYEVDY